MTFALSNRAQSDIRVIIRYTAGNFGGAQAEDMSMAYRSFELLADNPRMGREWTPGRRRYIYRMHHVYYRIVADGVFVTHIRHSSQNPI